MQKLIVAVVGVTLSSIVATSCGDEKPAAQSGVGNVPGGGVLSAAAKAFADEYCALIDPCCVAESRPSYCTEVAYGAGRVSIFDPNAAAACLESLRTYQARGDYCAHLYATRDLFAGGVDTCADGRTVTGCDGVDECGDGSDEAGCWWSALPNCAAVFHAAGKFQLAPGAPCEAHSDCAPPASGFAHCETDVAGNPVCVQTSFVGAGDACGGTLTGLNGNDPSQWAFEGGTPTYYAEAVCDAHDGLVCDDLTRVCTAVAPLCEASICPGTTCQDGYCMSTQECGPQTCPDPSTNAGRSAYLYCNRSCGMGSSCSAGADGYSHSCVPDIPTGSPCDRDLVAALRLRCAGAGGYCADNGTCAVPGRAGAPCSPASDTSFAGQNECLSRWCSFGGCRHVLAPLCG